MSKSKCKVTPELFALLEDLAQDDEQNTLREQLAGDRAALAARLGDDVDEYLPESDWSLPTREECQALVERYRQEGRGSRVPDVILHFSATERAKWT